MTIEFKLFYHLGKYLIMLRRMFSRPERWQMFIREFFRQMVDIGVGSAFIVLLVSIFIGAVTAVQTAYQLYGTPFVPSSYIGLIVRNTVIFELAPTFTALILAGKVGSNLASELGSMRVTEQIDAMEVSGTNPYKYLVVTRVAAATLMLPILTLLADAIALYGSYVGVNIHAITSFKLFYLQVFYALSFEDILPAFIKTFFFGFAVGMVGCYMGYHSQKGTEGVGRSANTAVVVSSVLIFILDLIAVQITDVLGLN